MLSSLRAVPSRSRRSMDDRTCSYNYVQLGRGTAHPWCDSQTSHLCGQYRGGALAQQRSIDGSRAQSPLSQARYSMTSAGRHDAITSAQQSSTPHISCSAGQRCPEMLLSRRRCADQSLHACAAPTSDAHPTLPVETAPPLVSGGPTDSCSADRPREQRAGANRSNPPNPW